MDNCIFCKTLVGPISYVSGGDFHCNTCGFSDYLTHICTDCRNKAYNGVSYQHSSRTTNCFTCGGAGKSYANGCSHSKSAPHYHCIHGNDFTSSVHD